MAYKGGHKRREQLAREKGFASYGEYRRASKKDRERASRALAKSNPRYARTGATKQVAMVRKPRAVRRVNLGGGRELLVSNTTREVRAFAKRALRSGEHVHATASIEQNGRRLTVEIWSRGGIDPQTLLEGIDTEHGARNYFAEQIAQVGAYGLQLGDFKVISIEWRAGLA